MHKPTLEGLEDYLAGRAEAPQVRALAAHLGECGECRELVGGMRAQAGLLGVLKAGREIEPAPGFYARVMDRIETQAAGSLWSAFIEPLFMRRFMYAAAALMVVLGFAAATVNNGAGLMQAMPVEMTAEIAMPDAASFVGDAEREVVFVNLASFGSGLQSAPAVRTLPAMED